MIVKALDMHVWLVRHRPCTRNYSLHEIKAWLNIAKIELELKKKTICEIICTLKETARLNVKTSDKNDRVKFDRMSIVLEIELSAVFNDNGFE